MEAPGLHRDEKKSEKGVLQQAPRLPWSLQGPMAQSPKTLLWNLVESGPPIPRSKFGGPLPLVKPAHSLGDDGVVEQGVPALLNLPKSEAAAELHTQVDRRQVISLQDPRLVCSGPSTGKNPSLRSHRVLLS